MKEIKNEKELNELLNGNTPVLLDFYADWCGPCQTLLPIVESLADQHKENFEIVKINIDKNREIARNFKVRSIPALFFVKDQEIQEKLVGLQTKQLLNNRIQEYAKAS